MTTSTLTLTEFLLARIAEDEASARYDSEQNERDQIGWYALRVLAECEAKRRIVGIHTDCDCEGRDMLVRHGNFLPAYVPMGCPTLLALALPYVDHPDYRQEWKP